MIHIEENQLKLLLEKKRKNLEKPRFDGIGEIISGISLMTTLVLSDFKNFTIMNPLYYKIIMWGISIIILLYGVYTFIKSFNFYSVEQLYSEIADLDPKMEHSFNIIVIKDNGRYLVIKNKRWKCWLFPNYHCLNANFSKTKELQYVKECMKRDFNLKGDTEIVYLGNKISDKYSVGDKVRKKYNFHYFEIKNIGLFLDDKKSFKYNGKKYCWMTLDKMYSNKNIVKKNNDVLDYVRRVCDIN